MIVPVEALHTPNSTTLSASAHRIPHFTGGILFRFARGRKADFDITEKVSNLKRSTDSIWRVRYRALVETCHMPLVRFKMRKVRIKLYFLPKLKKR